MRCDRCKKEISNEEADMNKIEFNVFCSDCFDIVYQSYSQKRYRLNWIYDELGNRII